MTHIAVLTTWFCRGASLVSLAVFAFIAAHPGRFFVGKNPGELVMYTTPLVLAVVMLGSEFLKPRQRLNLALLLFSTGTCLYAAELGITLLGLSETSQKTSRWHIQAKLQLLRELRKQGVEAVPVVSPKSFLLDDQGVVRPRLSVAGTELLPLGGISQKRVVDCSEGGDFLSYDADERGFHNPKGIWSLRPLAVAAVGDSFTHGNCVASGESFVARIRQRFPTTLNLGACRIEKARSHLFEHKPRF